MMFNPNVRNIAKFDFKSAIKSKGFIILNLVVFILSVILVNFSTILDFVKSVGIIPAKDYNIVLYDETQKVYENITANEDLNTYGILSIEKADSFITYEDKTEDSVDKTYLGINVVKSDEEIFEVQIISKNNVSSRTLSYIEKITTDTRNQMILEKLNIESDDLTLYKEKVDLNKIILSKDKESSTMIYLVNTILVYIIVMIIILVSNGLVVNIASEKTSKSTEYILSTVSTKDYLNGKILSANLKSIFTIALIIFYMLTALLINQVIVKDTDKSMLDNITIDSEMGNIIEENIGQIEDNAKEEITLSKIVLCAIITIVFLIVTLTMFCYIEAGFVAKVKNTSEVESAITLPMIILMVVIFVGMYSTEFSAFIVNILSFVPLLSLTIIPMAYLSGKVGIVTVIISLLLQVILTRLICKVVNKKFKKDILDLNDIKQNKKKNQEENILEQETTKIRKQEIRSFVMSSAISLITAIVLGNILSIVKFAFMDMSSTVNTFVDCVIFVCYIGLPALILKHMLNLKGKLITKSKNAMDDISKARNEKIVLYLVGIVSLIVIQLINTLVVTLFNFESGLVQSTITCDNTFLGVLAIIIQLAILPAIFEELLFRGIMLDGAKKYGAKFAIIFTSLAFGLFHSNPEQILGATLMGMVFSFITLRTGDIRVAMLLHFTNNLFSTFAYFSETSVGFIAFATMLILIFVFAIFGVVMLINTLKKDKQFFKLPEIENKKFEFNKNYFVLSFYGIILLIEIICTCILVL